MPGLLIHSDTRVLSNMRAKNTQCTVDRQTLQHDRSMSSKSNGICVCVSWSFVELPTFAGCDAMHGARVQLVDRLGTGQVDSQTTLQMFVAGWDQGLQEMSYRAVEIAPSR